MNEIIIYLLSYILLFALYISVRIIRTLLINKVNSKLTVLFTIDYVSEVIFKIASEKKINNINIKKAGYYYFKDGKKPEIGVLNKSNYNELDLIFCFHELGHFVDSRSTKYNKVYKIGLPFRISHIILTAILILIFFICTITDCNIMPIYFYCLILFFFCISSVFKIFVCTLLEMRASSISISTFKEVYKSDIPFYFQIKMILFLSVLEQLLMTLNYLFLIAITTNVQYKWLFEVLSGNSIFDIV